MKRFYNLLIGLMILILTGCTAPAGTAAASGSTDHTVMEVHFIDVGQGDATLIRSGDNYMLIDAGDDSKGTLVQNYLQKRGVEKLDYLVLTHPDSDHIGGAPVIITKFAIETVWMSDYTKDNRVWDRLMQSLDYRGLTYSTPAVGSTYRLGGAEITILGPAGTYDNPNDASIALMIRNGENRFLFTGDATEAAEQDIMAAGMPLKADVYKAGHHGSKTSSSADFINQVEPECAVISCAEGNSYGHPHAQTLNTLRFNGIKVYRTDEAGSMIATSDGVTVKFDVPASESWQAGEPRGSLAAGGIKSTAAAADGDVTYVLNSKTMKFHKPDCSRLPTSNRVDSGKSRAELVAEGYLGCGICLP